VDGGNQGRRQKLEGRKHEVSFKCLVFSAKKTADKSFELRKRDFTIISSDFAKATPDRLDKQDGNWL